MHVEPGMLFEPGFDAGVFVRSIVVADQVQRFVFRCFPIDLTQELQPFRVAMALLALTDHGAVEGIECGKKCGCAMTFVVMGHRRGASLLHRQTGLRAVKRLYLALLVAAQHERVLGWIQVQTHDVPRASRQRADRARP